MTFGSSKSCAHTSVVLAIVYIAIRSASGLSTAQPNNLLLFKRQVDPCPLQTGYFPGNHNAASMWDVSTTAHQVHYTHPPLHHDHHHSTRGVIHVDELPAVTGIHQFRPVDIPVPASNTQPFYYPVQLGSAVPYSTDYSCTDNQHGAITHKLIALSNAITRGPKIGYAGMPDLMASSSQGEEVLCPPPTVLSCTTTTSSPCTPQTSQPCNPQTCTPQSPCTPCQSNNPCTTVAPPCTPTAPCNPQVPCSPTPAACDPSKNKPEHNPSCHVVPAPKVVPPKNTSPLPPDPKCPYENRPAEPLFSKTSCIPVSPLHPASKHNYPITEPAAPCAPNPTPNCEPCPTVRTCEPCLTCQTKGIDPNCVCAGKPVVPADKPCCSEKNCDCKGICKKPISKGVLLHRERAKGCPDSYPEAYAAPNPTTYPPPPMIIPKVSFVVNHPGGHPRVGCPGQKLMYPFVPPPNTKPIPLIVAPNNDNNDDCVQVEVEHHAVAHPQNIQRPSKHDYHPYEDDDFDERPCPQEILRKIADKMGLQYDEDDDRRFSKIRHEEDREYGNQRRGYDRHSTKDSSKKNRACYDDDDDDNFRRWKSSSRGRYNDS